MDFDEFWATDEFLTYLSYLNGLNGNLKKKLEWIKSQFLELEFHHKTGICARNVGGIWPFQKVGAWPEKWKFDQERIGIIHLLGKHTKNYGKIHHAING